MLFFSLPIVLTHAKVKNNLNSFLSLTTFNAESITKDQDLNM